MSTKIFKSEIEFIDPEQCGSILGYKVCMQTSSYNQVSSVYGTIELGDCNRRISWEIESDNDGKNAVTKLNNAIRMLTQARNAVISANKLTTAANKKNNITRKDKSDVNS